MVGGKSAAGEHGIIVFTAEHSGSSKTITETDTFHSAQRQHGIGQFGIKFIENRLSPTRRDVSHFAAYHSADTVTGGPGSGNGLGHLSGSLFVR